MADRLSCGINTPERLRNALLDYEPEWIFFTQWSWIVPKEILEKYKCVGFHESDLPNFRGGSPIQNQIVRGIKKTKLTAFLMEDGLDTGDILLQEDLSLEGHLSDILQRVNRLSVEMMDKIKRGEYERRKQVGEGSFLRRRTPPESCIDMSKSLGHIYDFIRMLEDPYPNAYFYIFDKKITFKSAEFDKKLTCVVEIE